jgi:hypothetical protein
MTVCKVLWPRRHHIRMTMPSTTRVSKPRPMASNSGSEPAAAVKPIVFKFDDCPMQSQRSWIDCY